MLSLAVGGFALVLLCVVMQDAFEVMLLPRRVDRQLRLMRLFFRAAWAVWSAAASRLATGPRRERVLSVFGPLSIMALFTLWALGFIIGFGLLLWVLQVSAGADPPPAFFEQFYLSGATFFTLGYGDVVPHTVPTQALAVIEAGTGLSMIAMVISYLPVLYQLFARRETHVILLDARAGSPPTAGTLLSIHAGREGLGRLDALLQDWEVWAAELLESHLSYPMLAYYRSQHDNQSWLAAVAAIMDCCALILVGADGVSLLQARMTFAMLRQMLVEMNRSFGIVTTRPSPIDRLDHETFERLDASLSEGELTWAGGEETEHLLSALRTTYEPLLEALSRYLLVPLPGWLASAESHDHWDQGARGTLARRLIDDLTLRGASPAAARMPGDGGRSSIWRRLRTRLKPGVDPRR